MSSKEWASTGMNENEISMASSDENFSPPPTYTEAVSRDNASASNAASPSAFGATTELYIQAKGITPNTALFDTKPDPIPIFRLQPGTSLPSQFQGPEYISLRLKSSSNSCALVRGSDHTQTPLNSTIYRWGPGRPPRIRIFPSNSSLSVEDAIGTENLKCDEVVVKSRSMFSRSQKIVTPFGEFQWRYGDRAERKKAFDANSLLVMEKVDSIDVPGGKSEKRHIRVAQLIRNDELRTLGTDKYGAGNGGRLMIDIKIWEGEKESEAAKIEAFMVASCICMLKREADRMRDNMTAAIV